MPRSLRWVLLQTAPWGHRMRLPGWHLAHWLVARGNPVAYVSVPVSPWHFLSKGTRNLAARRWSQEGARGRWHAPNLFVHIPRTLLPIHRKGLFDSGFAWRNSHRLTIPNAAGVLRAEGFGEPDVVLLQSPLLAGLAEQLHPRVRVVSIEDALEHFDGMPRVAVRKFPASVRAADIVTVTARSLIPWARRRGASRILNMPNGVDVAAFTRPATAPQSRPAQPTGVYVGALDSWFDAELLAAVARRLAHWKFTIIGPQSRSFPALRGVKNVEFLGAIPPDDVPPFLWNATAGIIPFKRTPLIESVLPLKLFEYLAAGIPVVSTRWREMELVNSPARLAATPREFADALAAIENEKYPGTDGPRFAAKYDWNAIFPHLESRVRGVLDGADR